MTIHGWGSPIYVSEIAAEFGDPGSRPLWLTNYYRGGGRVPNISQNNNISTGGNISLGMFYGATNRAPPGAQVFFADTWFTVPTGWTVLHVDMIAGGGGGESGWGNYSGAGGAGGGGLAGEHWSGDISVVSGESLFISPGAGGLGGGTWAGWLQGGDTSPFGFAGQDGGPSRIIRGSNSSLIIAASGGLGAAKTAGRGIYGNATGYNPNTVIVTPVYDEYGTYLGDSVTTGSWHNGWAGQDLGWFDGNHHAGGSAGVGGPDGFSQFYPQVNGQQGALGSGGGGGASSNYNPNDAYGVGGNGGQGCIILRWN